MENSEAEIMAVIAEGDLSAIMELVELYQKPLINFASRFVGDKATPEDIVQEVFMWTF
jgi:DNA-directed RNA polymerase specialized sigma24 family protein